MYGKGRHPLVQEGLATKRRRLVASTICSGRPQKIVFTPFWMHMMYFLYTKYEHENQQIHSSKIHVFMLKGGLATKRRRLVASTFCQRLLSKITKLLFYAQPPGPP